MDPSSNVPATPVIYGADGPSNNCLPSRIEHGVIINDSSPSVVIPAMYPVTLCVTTTTVTLTPTSTQSRPCHTTYGAAQAFLLYAAWSNLNHSTIRCSQPALTMNIRQSPVIDTTRHYQHTASCAMHPLTFPNQALPNIHERQSPVIDRPTTDIYQESAVAGMRVSRRRLPRISLVHSVTVSLFKRTSMLFNCNKTA